MTRPPSFALALGGGGAAGLGHIAVLEALDDLGVRPVAIAGTSIGALIGASYAAGLTGREIRAAVSDMANSPVSTLARLRGVIGFTAPLKGLSVDPVAVVEAIYSDRVPRQFEDLQIPLTAVATDFHNGEEVRFSSGDLRRAVGASIAIPGVFRPVKWDGRVLVDGGVVNNLPFEALPPADITLAIDPIANLPPSSSDIPGPIEAATTAMRNMMRQQLLHKLKDRPDIVLIRPETCRFGPLDFVKTLEILAFPDNAFRETKRALLTAGMPVPSERRA
ncbi:MAG: patatin-like phospholipase family protein [Pseudomonadota bacterium]